jgi:alkylhydroperoxidase family enzyme
VAFGRPLGFSDEQLGETVDGDAGGGSWSDAERAVYRLADELHETGDISDALFVELERHFDARQILELVVTSGWYHTISFVVNAARVQLEPWAARFPARAKGASDERV